MAIQLKKGEGINLSKDHGLTRALLEVTYDLDPAHPVKKHEMDVNVSAFELSHASGKAAAPQDECFVFYNNLQGATGAVTHEKDGGSIGDDKLDIDFAGLDKNTLGIDEVSCIVEIYEGMTRGHHFGQLAHCTAHIINPDTNEVIAEFKLSDDDSNATAVQMGSFVKEDGHWHFKAVGVGYQKGLADFLHVYGLMESEAE
ncbi:TerD family protein [Acidithiobacillus sp. MC6.1]|nr:TerD family protein [Acidithiobacillus sp. MC6.1]